MYNLTLSSFVVNIIYIIELVKFFASPGVANLPEKDSKQD